MRRYLICAALLAALLTGCGNTSQMDSLIAAQETSAAAPAESSVQENAPAESAAEDATAPVPVSAFVPSEGDIDLTQLESTMVYAQVYDMVYNPDAYTGRKVRAKGPFSYYKSEETGLEYFAVLITDATACCAQGVEFVLDGEPVYPDDYPEAGTEIVIEGEFNSYEENGTTYVQLVHAQIVAGFAEDSASPEA